MSVFKYQVLSQPIFSTGHSNVTSPKIARLTGQTKMVKIEEQIPKKTKITTGPPKCKCMERVLIGDTKVEFLQQANLVGSCTVANLTTVMATMTAHIFPT